MYIFYLIICIFTSKMNFLLFLGISFLSNQFRLVTDTLHISKYITTLHTIKNSSELLAYYS